MTIRSLLLGLLCIIALAFLVSFVDLGLNIGWIGGAHLPAGAMGLLLFLVLGMNALLRFVSRKFCFTQAELLTAYCMMIVGALIPSFGLTAQLIPALAGINYFATPENHWAQIFFPHIRKWLVPFDPSRGVVSPNMRAFYEGLPPGHAVPWRDWLIPLTAWTSFAFLLFFAQLCLSSLLRKQWTDNEKLIFPLIQLPVELCLAEKVSLEVPTVGSLWPAFFHNRLMWIGFALPTFIHSLNGIHVYIPAVPQFPISIPLNPMFSNRPWSDLGITTIFISFSVIGFSYLVPLDIAFSFWFFFWLSRMQGVIASAVGIPLNSMPLFPGYNFVGYQSAGACVTMAVVLAWAGRRHLREIVSHILRGGEDSREPLPYLISFLGLCLAIVLLVAWLVAAGMTWPVATFVIVSLLFFLILIMSRCVNAAGLLMVQALFRPSDLMALAAPRVALGAGNLTVLCFLDTIFIRDLRGCLMPAFMDSFKIADLTSIDKRRMAGALGLAVIAATAASYLVILSRIYHRGGLQMSGWFLQSNPQIAWQQTAAVMQQKSGAEVQMVPFFLLGAAVTALLFFLRAKFFWWPLHPIGYAMGASWSLIVYWFAFFIGWLCKGIILRYGGSRLFLQARPFFLGLTLGEFAMAVVWALISAVTHKPMPQILVS